MEVLDTKHKRKAASITAILLLFLFISMFNFGMKYSDPPIEYGVAINFGVSDLGDSGESDSETSQNNSEEPEENSSDQELKEDVVEEDFSTNNQEEEPQVEDVNSEPVSADDSVVEKEDVISDDTSDLNLNKGVAKDQVEKVEKKIDKKVEEVKKEVVNKPVKPKATKKTKREVSNKTKNLLNGLLGGGAGKAKGLANEKGRRGSPQGDKKTSNYYGNKGGGGSKGNYQLSGRKALSKPKYNPECEKEGTVVVEIDVNRQGKVVRAKSCAKGTTNTAKCLCNAAKKAALATKWNATSKAKLNQRGRIIYRFSLSQ